MTFGGRMLTLNTATMLVEVFDVDRSGHIGFFEYCALHKFITNLQAAFMQHDRDRSGILEAREVCEAVAQGGFRFSLNTIQALVHRFKRKGLYGAADAQGLDMETFLQLCAYLGQIKSTFESHDNDRDGFIRINMENLVMLSTSMPSIQV